MATDYNMTNYHQLNASTPAGQRFDPNRTPPSRNKSLRSPASSHIHSRMERVLNNAKLSPVAMVGLHSQHL